MRKVSLESPVKLTKTLQLDLLFERRKGFQMRQVVNWWNQNRCNTLMRILDASLSVEDTHHQPIQPDLFLTLTFCIWRLAVKLFYQDSLHIPGCCASLFFWKYAEASKRTFQTHRFELLNAFMILKRHKAANEVKVWTFLGSPKFERENENLNHCATKLNPNGIIQTMPGQMKFISNLQSWVLWVPKKGKTISPLLPNRII